MRPFAVISSTFVYVWMFSCVCSLIKIALTSLGEARQGLISKSLLAYEHPIYQVLSLPPQPVIPLTREEIIQQQRERTSQHMKKIREALQ